MSRIEKAMQGKKDHTSKLYYDVTLEKLVPLNHVIREIDEAPDCTPKTGMTKTTSYRRMLLVNISLNILNFNLNLPDEDFYGHLKFR